MFLAPTNIINNTQTPLNDYCLGVFETVPMMPPGTDFTSATSGWNVREKRVGEQLHKEYYIIKPVLKQDRKYAPFIHTMDSVILKDGIDEVCERVYGEKR